MRRTAALLATTIVATATLAGCGGDSEYCAAVKKDQSTLESFGDKKTDAAYRSYGTVLRSLSKLAPADARTDWTRLANATQGVRRAQREAGISLEDMKEPDKLAAVDEAGRTSIQSSYDAFNRAVARNGKRVAANVKSECSITLR